MQQNGIKRTTYTWNNSGGGNIWLGVIGGRTPWVGCGGMNKGSVWWYDIAADALLRANWDIDCGG